MGGESGACLEKFGKILFKTRDGFGFPDEDDAAGEVDAASHMLAYRLVEPELKKEGRMTRSRSWGAGVQARPERFGNGEVQESQLDLVGPEVKTGLLQDLGPLHRRSSGAEEVGFLTGEFAGYVSGCGDSQGVEVDVGTRFFGGWGHGGAPWA